MTQWEPVISSDEWLAHEAARFSEKTDKQIESLPASGWDLDAERLISSLDSGMPSSFTSGDPGTVPNVPPPMGPPTPPGYGDVMGPPSYVPPPPPDPFGRIFSGADDTRAGLPAMPLTTAAAEEAMGAPAGPVTEQRFAEWLRGMGESADPTTPIGRAVGATAPRAAQLVGESAEDQNVGTGALRMLQALGLPAAGGLAALGVPDQPLVPGVRPDTPLLGGLTNPVELAYNVVGPGEALGAGRLARGGIAAAGRAVGRAVPGEWADEAGRMIDELVPVLERGEARLPGGARRFYHVGDTPIDTPSAEASRGGVLGKGLYLWPNRASATEMAGARGVPVQEFSADLRLATNEDWNRIAAEGVQGTDAIQARLVQEGFDGIESARGPGVSEVLVFPEAVGKVGRAVPEARLGEPPPPSTVRGLEKTVERLGSEEVPEGARAIELTPAEEVERLRLDQYPEELRPLIQEGAEQMSFFQGQRRGVMPDEVSEQLADEMAETRTYEQWVRQGKAGRAYNDVEIRALASAIANQARKVQTLSLEAAQPGADNSLAIARQFVEGEKLHALTALREGARAESGRAQRAWQMEAHLTRSPEEGIVRIFERVGGAENARRMAGEYAALVAEGGDPIQMANFWARIEQPPVGFADWWSTLRYNSMLSGPRTFEVNLIGNTMEVPWRIGRDVLAATGRAARGEGAAGFREVDAEILGWWTGLMKGSRPAWELVTQGITKEAAEAGDLPRSLSSRLDPAQAQRFPGLVGAVRPLATALEATGRGMAAVDELARQAAHGMAKGRLAAREANARGLKGEAWEQAYEEVIRTPDKLLDNMALDMADRMIYRGEMGHLGQLIHSINRPTNPPVVRVVGNLMIPFLRTVYHISARGFDRSPLGSIGTGIDVARGAYRGGKVPQGAAPLGERLGDNLMGGLIGTWFGYQALQGNITADGPDSQEDRDLLRAQGWQPYSLRLPNGEWVSYANWGPVAISLSEAGAVGDAWNYRKDDRVDALAASSMKRAAGLVKEQPYLQGIGAVWKAFDDFERYGSQWLTQTMASLIPYGGAINTVGQALDPSERQTARGLTPQAVAEGVQARIPGAREALPERRTITGERLPNPYAGWRAVVPMRSTGPTRGADVRRYEGSRSVAMDREIQQAVQAVEEWERAPERFRTPTQRQQNLYAQYAGTEQPIYMERLRGERERRQEEQVRRGGG